MEKEWKSLLLWRSVIAECLASFLYVFLVCTVTLNWSPNVYRAILTTADLLQISLASGLALSTLTQCFGHISGAHINPAISISMLVTCKVTPLRGILYVIAQCGGGIAGAALLYGVVPENTRGLLGSTSPLPSLTSSQGFGVEFLMTFILTFTFFATVDPKRRNHGNEAIPLGLTMTLLHIVGYRLTGSSCNPARSLGPAFIKNTWTHHWVYWAGPIAGAVVAALLYQFVFDHERAYRQKACSLTGLQQLNTGADQTDSSFAVTINNKSKKKVTPTAVLPSDGITDEPGTSQPHPTAYPSDLTQPHLTAYPSDLTQPHPAAYSSNLTQPHPAAYSSDLTAAFFRADSTRKYLAQLQEPRAPPGSVETGLDVVVPHTSHYTSPISSDVIMPGINILRQRSYYSGSSDYELHELENVVNSLKNVV